MPNREVMISYSKANRKIAETICEKLELKNLHCWIAPRDIPAGSEWMEAIVTAIDSCRVMVLVFSAESNESKQVLREVTLAVKKKVTIIPVRIDAVEPNKSLEYLLLPRSLIV